MELIRYWRVIRRWAWLIILCPLVAGLAAGLISLQLPKVYEAKVAEREILRTDAAIARRQRAIFSLLTAGGRSAFARGERSWLAYREAFCNARASSYTGGSIAPVIFGTCEAGINEGHLRTLSAFRRELEHR